jgi:hypothetical protein
MLLTVFLLPGGFLFLLKVNQLILIRLNHLLFYVKVEQHPVNTAIVQVYLRL